MAAPEECCGLLVGRRHANGVRIDRAVPASNGWPGDRRRRYEIPPEELLAHHRAARSAGLEVVGYYHSHPGGGARPSAFDRERAWPDTLYLIAATPSSGAAEIAGWRLVGGELVPEAIEFRS